MERTCGEHKRMLKASRGGQSPLKAVEIKKKKQTPHLKQKMFLEHEPILIYFRDISFNVFLQLRNLILEVLLLI